MREDDPEIIGKSHAAVRLTRTLGGVGVVLGGIGYAFFNPGRDWVGFLVALIGAGIVDPNVVVNFFKKGG